jgi:glycosyltransferase involved in cell wall biosynthesis
MNTCVHVVHIITKLELGGAQKVCLSLVKGLHASGHTCFLISGNDGILVKEAQQYKNVDLLPSFVWEVSPKTLWKEIKTLILIIKKLRALKKKYPHLIVHTHSTKAGLVGRWAAFFAGIKKRVHTIHGYGFNDFQPKLVWWIIYILELVTSLITTHFICVSQRDAETGMRLFPRFSKKYSIIRAAIEWQPFECHQSNTYSPAHRDKPMQPFIFGTVACFKKPKNLLAMFSAFKKVHALHPHTKLEIIGDGVLRPQLESWIRDHHMTSAITLHGWHIHIAPIMSTWHTFVLTSLWEGLPCAVIEARLLKLPVISYKTGGIPEVIYHHKNGLLFEINDVNGIAHGMATLVQHPHTLNTLRNFPDNLEAFKSSTMLEQHISLYQKQ